MPLDGARAQEQPRADLGVGQSVARKSCDLQLLWSQLVASLGLAPADCLTSGQQLAAGAFRARCHSHLGQHRVRNPQLLTSILAPAAAAQPFAIEQVGARKIRTQLGPLQLVDGLRYRRSACSPSLISARPRASMPSAHLAALPCVSSASSARARAPTSLSCVLPAASI